MTPFYTPSQLPTQLPSLYLADNRVSLASPLFAYAQGFSRLSGEEASPLR